MTAASSDGTASSTVQGFLSYSHADDLALNGVAAELKSRIEGLFLAKTGRQLKIFVDRADIGWGEDWREKIAEAVRSATVFIPVITMNYFNRDACREELMAYYSNAKILGATGLLLPLVVAGARGIKESDPREEVRIVERLQWVDLEGAWPQGFASPAWLTAMSEVTDKLIDALERAEDRIATIEIEREDRPPTDRVLQEALVGAGTPDTDARARSEADSDEAGIFYLGHELREHANAAAEAMPVAMSELQDFTSLLQEVVGNLGNVRDKRAVGKANVIAANRLKEPASRFGDSASTMLTHLAAADGALRQILSDVDESGSRSARRYLRESLSALLASFADAPELLDQIDEMVGTAALLQRNGVSMRMALAPAHRGLVAVRDSVRLLSSWKMLFGEA